VDQLASSRPSTAQAAAACRQAQAALAGVVFDIVFCPPTPLEPWGRTASCGLLFLQGEFNLSNLQDGFLATAFLVGLLIASPIFSEACKHYSAFR
jgi:hypothetical protein